jgi:hypothetical protein
MPVSAKDVAAWMLEELKRDEYLYQDVAVTEIESRFGASFIYINDSGNQAIAKDVLAEFKKITRDTVVWERGQRLWRKREDYDEAGRSQY